MSSSNDLLTTSYLVFVVTFVCCMCSSFSMRVEGVAFVLGAVTMLQERRSDAAEIENSRRFLDLAKAEHSSVIDDLRKTIEKDISNIVTVLQFTKKSLKDAQTALEQSQRIAATHFEFREALAKELARTRTQRNWAAAGVDRSLDALNEAERKASSQELVAYEMQCQIRFKANELRDMTLSLEIAKKELAIANEFSQKAQDEIDEQNLRIEEQEKLVEKKEQIILGLSNQIRDHKIGCRRMHSTIERPNLGVESVLTKLENMNRNLTEEAEDWCTISQNWSTNNVHAMGSEIEGVRGELAEFSAENKRLTRDLKAMVKHAEIFYKEREFMTQQIEQLVWDVNALKIAKKENGSAEDMDVSATEDEEEDEEEGEEEYPSWFPDGDDGNDDTSHKLNEDSEKELEWFVHTPTATTATKCIDEWYTKDANLIRNEGRNQDLDQWIEDVDTLVNNEDGLYYKDLYESLYSEDETLAITTFEEEGKDMA